MWWFKKILQTKLLKGFFWGSDKDLYGLRKEKHSDGLYYCLYVIIIIMQWNDIVIDGLKFRYQPAGQESGLVSHTPHWKVRKSRGGKGSGGLCVHSLVSFWTFRQQAEEEQHCSVSSAVNQQLLEPRATQGPAL